MNLDGSQQGKLNGIFERYTVQLAYLFGSQATGKSGPLSDTDIAVLLPQTMTAEGRFSKRLLLLYETMTLIGTSHLDLVILNDAPPALSFNVISEGQVLFCPNPETRIIFEYGVLQNYLDTEFLRKTYNHYLFENIREGILR